MKIQINVRVNLLSDHKIYTVWARPHQHLPGVEFYTGQGQSLTDAVEDLFNAFPDQFVIDDEIQVSSKQIDWTPRRPFEMVRSESIRIFQVV